MIPGRFLYRLAGTLCSPAMLERAIEPQLADLQHEWADNRLRVDRRAFLLARGYLSFWIALLGCLARDLGHDPSGFGQRIGRRSLYVAAWPCVVLVAFGAPSWVRTGAVSWTDVGRGFIESTSGIPFIAIMWYRKRHAKSRAWVVPVVCVVSALAGNLVAGNWLNSYFVRTVCTTGSAFLFKRGDLDPVRQD